MLSLLDDNAYKLAQTKLNIVVQATRQRLPVPVVKQLDIYLAYIKNLNVVVLRRFQTFCVTAFERLQEAYVSVSFDENFLYFINSISSGWHIVWIKICELYRTVTSLVL